MNPNSTPPEGSTGPQSAQKATEAARDADVANGPQKGIQRVDATMVAAALAHMARAQEAIRLGIAGLEAALSAPLTTAEDGICTATIRNSWSGRTVRCTQPAGHYDEAREPTFDEDADDPGGWHRGPANADGTGRAVWADRADGATPHTATGGPDA